jgi:U3 small nucleolar ribonucleoprotein protein IMP4
MQRRNARMRREYLYRKSLETQDRAQHEKKRKLREALAGEEKRCVPRRRTAREDAH